MNISLLPPTRSLYERAMAFSEQADKQLVHFAMEMLVSENARAAEILLAHGAAQKPISTIDPPFLRCLEFAERSDDHLIAMATAVAMYHVLRHPGCEDESFAPERAT